MTRLALLFLSVSAVAASYPAHGQEPPRTPGPPVEDTTHPRPEEGPGTTEESAPESNQEDGSSGDALADTSGVNSESLRAIAASTNNRNGLVPATKPNQI